MRYVAAYLLAVLGGNNSPSKEDISKILGSIGLDIDEDKLGKVVSELKGKDINEVIAEGSSKLAQMPSGGAAVASSGATAGGGSSDEPAAEAKKEEKKEEESDQSDDDMGFGLFD